MRTHIIAIIIALILSVTANGAPLEIPLNRDSADNSSAVFIYPSATGNTTAILICPGGGYSHLAMDYEGHQFAQWLNSLGLTAAVLKYRMPEGNSEIPGDDARQAIALLRQRDGIDSVGIMGFSAGGHLASTVATHYDTDSRPDFQILFYPVISMKESLTHRGSRRNLISDKPSPDLERLYSNETQVTKDTPKAIIFHSSDDRTVSVDNAIAYFSALKACGVDASLHIFPNGGHGWGFRDSFAYKPQWMSILCKWMEENGILRMAPAWEPAP